MSISSTTERIRARLADIDAIRERFRANPVEPEERIEKFSAAYERLAAAYQDDGDERAANAARRIAASLRTSLSPPGRKLRRRV